jgi:hypothetical protein
MAGGSVACRCGRKLAVPPLSELRRGAGADAYVTNAVEVVRQKLSRGELPAGPGCVRCGSSAHVMVTCRVVCERPFASGSDDDGGSLVGFLSLGWLSFLRRKRAPASGEVHGRETVLELPLGLCDSCRSEAGNLRRPRVLRRLIAAVPDYQRLLDEYPEAELQFAGVSHGDKQSTPR